MTLLDRARAYATGRSDDGAQLVGELVREVREVRQLRRLADGAGLDAERAIQRADKLKLDLKCLEESTVDSKAYEQLQAERDRLAEALRKIAAGEGVYGMQAHEYKQIARAALEADDE